MPFKSSVATGTCSIPQGRSRKCGRTLRTFGFATIGIFVYYDTDADVGAGVDVCHQVQHGVPRGEAVP